MSSPRHRASGPSLTCLAAALVLMIGVVSAAATILYNSLEPHVAHTVSLSLGDANVAAVDFSAKSVLSGHKLDPSLVSVSEKTLEDFQVPRQHSHPTDYCWPAADDQDFIVGVPLANESVINVNADPYWQDSNLMACDLRETSTKVHIDPVSQGGVCADVITNGTLVNHLLQLIPVHVSSELLPDNFILDTPIDKDHVVDLES
eukprot:4610485-Amphidinium_carterae.1